MRRLGNVPLRRRRVFHLKHHCDVIGTYQETSLRRRHDVSLPGGILHIGTNDAPFLTIENMFKELKKLRDFTLKFLPDVKLILNC